MVTINEVIGTFWQVDGKEPEWNYALKSSEILHEALSQSDDVGDKVSPSIRIKSIRSFSLLCHVCVPLAHFFVDRNVVAG